MESSLSLRHEPHHLSHNLNFRTPNPLLNRRNLNLGFRTNSAVSVSASASKPNRSPPQPLNRYHFDGTARKFFEGWYFKVSIPERRQSFCFMYSVENPAFRQPLTELELAQHGPRTTGVGAQILGADDKYICQYSEKSKNFWGSKYRLSA
ncbi:hypothetical protein ACLB2K_015012 [Fragaria x ananassa]